MKCRGSRSICEASDRRNHRSRCRHVLAHCALLLGCGRCRDASARWYLGAWIDVAASEHVGFFVSLYGAPLQGQSLLYKDYFDDFTRLANDAFRIDRFGPSKGLQPLDAQRELEELVTRDPTLKDRLTGGQRDFLDRTIAFVKAREQLMIRVGHQPHLSFDLPLRMENVWESVD